MTGDRSDLLAALIVIGTCAFAIGAASLQKSYLHGSPRCANACAGTASIFHGEKCYCLAADATTKGASR